MVSHLTSLPIQAQTSTKPPTNSNQSVPIHPKTPTNPTKSHCNQPHPQTPTNQLTDPPPQDYPLIIKHPMDLSKIKRNLALGKYKEPWEFVDDVWLMFNNCWLYNRKSTRVYKNCNNVGAVVCYQYYYYYWFNYFIVLFFLFSLTDRYHYYY